MYCCSEQGWWQEWHSIRNVHCSDELLKYLLDLFSSVWDAESVSQEWRDALLVPVSKNEDFSLCDNWCDIIQSA